MVRVHKGTFLQGNTITPKVFAYLKKITNGFAPHEKLVILTFNEFKFDLFANIDANGYSCGEKVPSDLIVPSIRFVSDRTFHILGSLFYYRDYREKNLFRFSSDIAECMKLYILALQNIELTVIATVAPYSETFRTAVEELVQIPYFGEYIGPLSYIVGGSQIVHIHDPALLENHFAYFFIEHDLVYYCGDQQYRASPNDIEECFKIEKKPLFKRKSTVIEEFVPVDAIGRYYLSHTTIDSLLRLAERNLLPDSSYGTALFIKMFKESFEQFYANTSTAKFLVFNEAMLQNLRNFVYSLNPTRNIDQSPEISTVKTEVVPKKSKPVRNLKDIDSYISKENTQDVETIIFTENAKKLEQSIYSEMCNTPDFLEDENTVITTASGRTLTAQSPKSAKKNKKKGKAPIPPDVRKELIRARLAAAGANQASTSTDKKASTSETIPPVTPSPKKKLPDSSVKKDSQSKGKTEKKDPADTSTKKKSGKKTANTEQSNYSQPSTSKTYAEADHLTEKIVKEKNEKNKEKTQTSIPSAKTASPTKNKVAKTGKPSSKPQDHEKNVGKKKSGDQKQPGPSKADSNFIHTNSGDFEVSNMLDDEQQRIPITVRDLEEALSKIQSPVDDSQTVESDKVENPYLEDAVKSLMEEMLKPDYIETVDITELVDFENMSPSLISSFVSRLTDEIEETRNKIAYQEAELNICSDPKKPISGVEKFEVEKSTDEEVERTENEPINKIKECETDASELMKSKIEVITHREGDEYVTFSNKTEENIHQDKTENPITEAQVSKIGNSGTKEVTSYDQSEDHSVETQVFKSVHISKEPEACQTVTQLVLLEDVLLKKSKEDIQSDSQSHAEMRLSSELEVDPSQNQTRTEPQVSDDKNVDIKQSAEQQVVEPLEKTKGNKNHDQTKPQAFDGENIVSQKSVEQKIEESIESEYTTIGKSEKQLNQQRTLAAIETHVSDQLSAEEVQKVDEYFLTKSEELKISEKDIDQNRTDASITSKSLVLKEANVEKGDSSEQKDENMDNKCVQQIQNSVTAESETIRINDEDMGKTASNEMKTSEIKDNEREKSGNIKEEKADAAKAELIKETKEDNEPPNFLTKEVIDTDEVRSSNLPLGFNEIEICYIDDESADERREDEYENSTTKDVASIDDSKKDLVDPDLPKQEKTVEAVIPENEDSLDNNRNETNSDTDSNEEDLPELLEEPAPLFVYVENIPPISETDDMYNMCDVPYYKKIQPAPVFVLSQTDLKMIVPSNETETERKFLSPIKITDNTSPSSKTEKQTTPHLEANKIDSNDISDKENVDKKIIEQVKTNKFDAVIECVKETFGAEKPSDEGKPEEIVKLANSSKTCLKISWQNKDTVSIERVNADTVTVPSRDPFKSTALGDVGNTSEEIPKPKISINSSSTVASQIDPELSRIKATRNEQFQAFLETFNEYYHLGIRKLDKSTGEKKKYILSDQDVEDITNSRNYHRFVNCLNMFLKSLSLLYGIPLYSDQVLNRIHDDSLKLFMTRRSSPTENEGEILALYFAVYQEYLGENIVTLPNAYDYLYKMVEYLDTIAVQDLQVIGFNMRNFILMRNLWMNNSYGIEELFRNLRKYDKFDELAPDLFRTDHVFQLMEHIAHYGNDFQAYNIIFDCSPLDIEECFDNLTPKGSVLLVE